MFPRVSLQWFTRSSCAAILTLAACSLYADGRVEKNIQYRASDAELAADDYQRTQCKLDVYIPEGVEDFPTVVWFHGGGLTGGRRYFPDMENKGIALVAVGYQLYPQGEFPASLDDAAAAVAWTLENIASYGGDPDKVFVSGISAGGYLTAMVGMDPQWLGAYGHSSDELAGLIPISGQMTTHFNVKKWRGDKGPRYRPLVDEFAPLYYVRPGLPPVCLIVGDRDLDIKGRTAGNQLMADSLRAEKNDTVELYILNGFDHGQVSRGAYIIMPRFINGISARQSADAK